MRKKVACSREQCCYQIISKFGNIAEVEFDNGMKCLLNLDTNNIIWNTNESSVSTIKDIDGQTFYVKMKKEKTESGNVTKVWVYDVNHQKTIVEDWEMDEENSILERQVYVLKSPQDEKMHCLCLRRYSSNSRLFCQGFDAIEAISNEYLMLQMNNQKQLYYAVTGKFFPYAIDNARAISNYSDLIIDWKGTKNYLSHNMNFIEGYDRILIDPNKLFIYGETKDGTDILCLEDGIKIAHVDGYAVKFLTRPSNSIYPYNNFLFSFQKNEKSGILSVMKILALIGHEWEGKILLPPNYDSVTMIDDYQDFFRLQDGTKFGLAYFRNRKFCVLEPRYDKIDRLTTNLFACYHDNTCDLIQFPPNIYKKDNSGERVVDNCKVCDVDSEGVIFKDKKGMGLFSIISYNCGQVVFDGCKKIQNLGNHFYAIYKNKKAQLYCGNHNSLKEEQFDSISSDPYKNSDSIFDRKFFFSFQKNGRQYLGRYWNRYNRLEIDSTPYQSISFFPDIIALQDEKETKIVDRSLQELKSFMPDVTITSMPYRQNKKASTIYYVDDIPYQFQCGCGSKFNPVLVKDMDFYAAGYESDSGTVVVNSFDEDEFLEKCKMLDETSPHVFEKTLKKLNKKVHR